MTLTQDEAGNLQATQDQEYTWDALGRLVSVEAPNGSFIQKYVYDAGGHRVGVNTTNSGNLNGHTLFCNVGDQVGGVHDEDGELVTQFIHGVSVDEVVSIHNDADGDGDANEDEDDQYYVLSDRLGSTTALLEEDGDVAEGYDYEPYGDHEVFAPGSNDVVDYGGDDAVTAYGESGLGNPFMYTGREWDAASGQYYYRARYMEPGLGRFLSRDAVASLGVLGSNYAYVGSSPSNGADPMGEIALWLRGFKTWGTKEKDVAFRQRAQDPAIQDLTYGDDYVLIHNEWRGNNWAQATQTIRAALKQNPMEIVILVGYSWGGNGVIDLSNRLAELGIGVDLLITIDPYDATEHEDAERKCDNRRNRGSGESCDPGTYYRVYRPRNVEYAVNFYAPGDNWQPDGAELAVGFDEEVRVNGANHGNIQGHALVWEGERETRGIKQLVAHVSSEGEGRGKAWKMGCNYEGMCGNGVLYEEY